jgi:hypothetical protein
MYELVLEFTINVEFIKPDSILLTLTIDSFKPKLEKIL